MALLNRDARTFAYTDGLGEEAWWEPEPVSEGAPSTLREDQPLLADAYRQAADRIVAQAVASGEWPA